MDHSFLHGGITARSPRGHEMEEGQSLACHRMACLRWMKDSLFEDVAQSTDQSVSREGLSLIMYFGSHQASELTTERGLMLGEYCSSSCSSVVERSLMWAPLLQTASHHRGYRKGMLLWNLENSRQQEAEPGGSADERYK